MKIVSLDPGGTTGICIFTWHGDYSNTPYRWDIEELGPSDHYLALDLFLTGELSLGGIDFLLCEGFDNRANAAAQLISCEYIGVVKRWREAHNVEVTWTSPSVLGSKSKPGFVTDRKLKSLGLWDLTKAKPHGRDATRHLVHHVMTRMKRHSLYYLFHEICREV